MPWKETGIAQMRKEFAEQALSEAKTKAALCREYGLRGVHDLPNGAAVTEKLFHMNPVSDPYVYGSGVLAPRLFETLKFILCRR